MKLKLTLRDLFWLVLAVAMGCAWWVDRSRLAVQLGNLQELQSQVNYLRGYSEALEKRIRESSN